MMIELILTQSEDRAWRGVVRVEGDLFLATIFPGSAVKEWDSSLQPISFLPLSPDNPLTLGLERGLERMKREEEFGVEVARLIERNPEVKKALDELRVEEKGGEEDVSREG